MDKRRIKTFVALGVVAWIMVLLRFTNMPIWSPWRNEQLLHAVQSRNVKGVTFWLEAGADANVGVYADYRPLNLLGEPAIFTTHPEENRIIVPHSLLLTAITSGPDEQRAAVIAALLSHGADANASTEGTGDLFSYYTVPLREAFAKHDKETVRLLVEHGANVNMEGTNSGNGLIFDVIFNEDHDLLRMLLQHGAHQSPDRDGATPLHRAAELGDAKAMRILLEYGAKVNETDRGSKTALMFAARDSAFIPGGQDSQEKAIKFLLAHGASVEARDATGKTALLVAVQNSQRTASRLLLDAGANANAKN